MMNGKTAKIIANGEEKQINLPCTVADFLQICGWRPTQVVVELNGKVLSRNAMSQIEFQDGDRVEIILPVAGG